MVLRTYTYKGLSFSSSQSRAPTKCELECIVQNPPNKYTRMPRIEMDGPRFFLTFLLTLQGGNERMNAYQNWGGRALQWNSQTVSEWKHEDAGFPGFRDLTGWYVPDPV